MSDAAVMSWLVQALVWTAVVFAIVRLADGALARWLGPRARMVLYALVFVRALLPADYQSPLGLAPASDQTTTVVAEPTGVAVPWLSRAHVEASAADSSPVVPSAPAPWWPWIYGAGVLALLGVGVRRHRTLTTIAETSTPLDLGGGRDIEVRVHPHAGPFAHGIVRRFVVLPRGLVDTTSKSALGVVVAHERAHHLGRDTVLSPVLGLACTLVWPVLPVWLARHRVRTLIEHAADERAVGSAGANRKDYGRVLLGLVEHAREAPTPVPSLGAYRDLRARLTALLRPATTSTSLQLVGVVGISAAVLACAAVPTDDAPEPVERSTDEDCDEIRSRAMAAHDAAERQADPARRSEALRAYGSFEDACADHPEYADTLYYAAEAYWADAVAKHDAGEHEAAPTSFNRARALFDAAIDEGSSYAKDAALGQHLAVKNGEGWQPSDETQACVGEDCDDALAFIAYDASETAVLESWERYVEVHGRPVGVDADALLDIAYLRMRHNDFEANIADLEELTERHAGTEAGLRGAEMLVDVLTIGWVNAEGEARRSAGETLVAWLDRIAASKTVDVPGSERLVEAITTLKKGVAWKAAQSD